MKGRADLIEDSFHLVVRVANDTMLDKAPN